MTNRSCIRPFHLCQNQRHWMTLNGRYALYHRKHASFGAQRKHLIEDRSILSAAICRPVTLVSGNIRFMRIFADVPWGGRQTTVGSLTTAILQRQFSAFSLAIFRKLWRWGQRYYIAIRRPSSDFQWSQNAWPWVTLNIYFALNSVFAPVWLAPTVHLWIIANLRQGLSFLAI